ncbi:NagD protein [Asanoa hainanensis]|uniref:NagD protein n=2 Tax=Asanoa hainanensis TaxID=560556 RepID=A0A239KFN8_9ACTN|nr:NagD protein [Asanoa hainanensis]
MAPIETFPLVEHWLVDMDGVLVRGGEAIPGAEDFVGALTTRGVPFLALTNNSLYPPDEVSAKLAAVGLKIPETAIWTCAQATARFLATHHPGGSAYLLGEAGLVAAMAGYDLDYVAPDYVVLGELASYSAEAVARACALVAAGARFIATNPDRSVPTPAGTRPACGAVAAMITAATGVTPYFIGKPNPTMMRTGLSIIGGDPRTTAMVGDRMDTDIVGGVEAGLRTVLVLSGCTRRADEVRQFPYQPDLIVNSVADLVELVWR